jgi:hypothetical protein
MTSTAESLPREARPVESPVVRWLAASERLLVRLSELLNPILVKEARQSLKSRQFLITFGLLLACGWLWSFLGLALIRPDASYMGKGAEMCMGYLVILAFPLLVIVPFGAFRSLAVEQEDRTYELLSITALGPRQIISGKLASAGVQMLVYLSAIAPCLAFTYLLRGIAFPTILMILFYLVLGSLGLSVVGLLVGTITGERHWQVVLSVVLIIGLLGAFGIGWTICYNLIWEGDLFIDAPEFWVFNAALMTAYLTYFALACYAAVAQITFATDNRSTRLRVVMLIQHVCFTGWMAWVMIAVEMEEEFLLVYLSMIALHWYAMGSLMIGESPALSPRVKRSLPQSFLGRAFLTWFNPGPGSGYLFAVCGMVAAVAMALVAVILSAGFGGLGIGPFWSTGDSALLLAAGVVFIAYLTIYLGLGLLIIRLLHRFGQVAMLLGVLIQILLVAAGCAVPAVVETMLWGSYLESGYSLLHLSNPFWTLMHLCDGPGLPVETAPVLFLLAAASLLVFVLNLPWVVREVREVRIAKPKRVAEEDAELAAPKVPPKPVRISPWDVAGSPFREDG